MCHSTSPNPLKHELGKKRLKPRPFPKFSGIQGNKSRDLTAHGCPPRITSLCYNLSSCQTLPSPFHLPGNSPRACWDCGLPVSALVCNTTGGSSSALLGVQEKQSRLELATSELLRQAGWPLALEAHPTSVLGQC